MPEQSDVIKNAVKAAKDVVAGLEAEETRLAGELASVKAKKKDAHKFLASMEDTAPRRRRGRPPKNAPEPEPVAA